jgi:hypothetical protein
MLYVGRQYTPHLRNTFESVETHLVRVELYRYSKAAGEECSLNVH